MRKYLMEILVCPACSVGLELFEKEGTAEEIVTGSLHCGTCGSTFEIHNRIANLFVPTTKDPQASSTPRSVRGNLS